MSQKRQKKKARIISDAEQLMVYEVIKEHRHAEKNLAILKLVFVLGLTVKEISGLTISDVATVKDGGDKFILKEKISIYPPNSAHELSWILEHKTTSDTTLVRMLREDFDRLVMDVARKAKRGELINPIHYRPEPKKYHKTSRQIALLDKSLTSALSDYLYQMIDGLRYLSEDMPLFITQKNGPYSPNTLQDHIALILKGWCELEGASSMSGKITLVKRMTDEGMSWRDIQKALGYSDLAFIARHNPG
jgi:integrase